MVASLPARPQDVPDFASHAAEALTSGYGAMILRSFLQVSHGDEISDEAARTMGSVALSGLAHSHWWLARDYMDFVEGAAATLPSSDYLTPDVAVDAIGALWLSRPMTFVASDGTPQAVDVISWNRVHLVVDLDGTENEVFPRGLMVCGWVHIDNTEDPASVDLRPQILDDAPLHLSALIMVPILGSEEATEPSVEGDHATRADEVAHLTEGAVEHPMVRSLRAFFGLHRARATSVTHEALSRPMRRRLERAGLPSDPVRVIDLRNPGDGSGRTVEARRDWSHRWLVSGHWRNQWYPSEGVHRPIWIDAFVKGPSDAPLLVRPTVYRPHAPEEAS